MGLKWDLYMDLTWNQTWLEIPEFNGHLNEKILELAEGNMVEPQV